MLSKASKDLKEKKERLLENLNADNFLDKNAVILDEYFCNCFETSRVGPKLKINKNPFAIVALGGYGRMEQCVHSDVDILFLFNKEIPSATSELIEEIIYPLWDVGFQVGHATRSIKECTELAQKDVEVLTSLIDARFICGMSNLYTQLCERLTKKIISAKSKTIISWLMDKNNDRHKNYGDSSYLLEPNLKDGQGGLRDYHTMLWIARIKSQIKQPRDLECFGYLSSNEYDELSNSLNFIWKVRNFMHRLAGRKCDQLYFDYQVKLAENLNFQEENGLPPVEIFLGKLHSHMEFIKQQYIMFVSDINKSKKTNIKENIKKRIKIEGFDIEDDSLIFINPEQVVKNPEIILRIFQESARLQIPLNKESKRIIKEFAYLFDSDLKVSPNIIKIFEKILLTQSPKFNVLEDMLTTGILEKFFPEFKRILNRVQFNQYHLYPVDKHCLRTVQTIKQFGTSDDQTLDNLCGDIYREIKNQKLLLWAALFHDIGKGFPNTEHCISGAECVKIIMTRIGYSNEDIESIAFLVEKHLFILNTAKRRDIHEEETAVFCAREIRDIERLRMLYLLTVADFISTGPKAWNNWTASLVTDLFFKTFNILKKGELSRPGAIEEISNKMKDIRYLPLSSTQQEELHEHFKTLSARYILSNNKENIIKHFELFKLLGNESFVWDIDKNLETNTRTLTFCGKDQRGLFSKIAGAFTLNNFDIFDAQIYTWNNGIALDIFTLKQPIDTVLEKERWDRAKDDLKKVLDGKIDLKKELSEKITKSKKKQNQSLIREDKIIVDIESSSFYTIIEIHTTDFQGLLFCITDALYEIGVNIKASKISTSVDQVVDVFYIQDKNKNKIDSPEFIDEIKKAVKRALSPTFIE
ncbi:MAG: [protein-PII] uridylyltransferase [Desulfobacterales bacterium]|nr:[protein-PII] uridylyltransferase [Desulfobacterales bacterium]